VHLCPVAARKQRREINVAARVEPEKIIQSMADEKTGALVGRYSR
jgi:hypothetical protein